MWKKMQIVQNFVLLGAKIKNKAFVRHKVEKDTREVPSVKKQLFTAAKLKSRLF